MHENFDFFIFKFIIVFLSQCIGLIQEKKRNFKRESAKTWPPNMEFVGFLILKNANEVWKAWNLARCHYMTPRGYENKLRMFRKSHDVLCLKLKYIPERIRVSRGDIVGLKAKWPLLYPLALNFLIHLKYPITRPMSKFDIFRSPFDIFKSLNVFIGI